MTARIANHRDNIPAGILAVLVHAIFFSLLYFGFSWQSHRPAMMVVEMWEELPESPKLEKPLEVVAPPPPPKAVEPKPVLPNAADIALENKKKKLLAAQEKKAEQDKKELLEKKRKVEALIAREHKATEQLDQDKKIQSERQRQQEARIKSEQARVRQEADAATRSEIDRYKEKIQSKIRRNIIMPPDVPAGAEAKFFVRVLPGGDVVEVMLEKSSGNAAYDSAAERAIYKSRPLPMPPNPELERMFRELRLSLKP
jgi:colicin import membrane protein